jgi:ADP-ribose pyrophosphatase YjhB (NUDIX family)
MPTLGVFGAILDKQQRVLCVRLNYAARTRTTPGGGVEPGESPIAALEREVLEEAALGVAVGRTSGVYSKPQKDDLVLSFAARIIRERPSHPNEEIGRWVTSCRQTYRPHDARGATADLRRGIGKDGDISRGDRRSPGGPPDRKPSMRSNASRGVPEQPLWLQWVDSERRARSDSGQELPITNVMAITTPSVLQGLGSPAVVFDSGLGDGTRVWGLIQPDIAKHTRACSYDRAGLGFSDPPIRPSTSANAVDDLHRLLHAAHVGPPYILVGH